MSDDPYVVHDGHLPTPFTAAEIAAATPVGRWVEAVETIGGEVVGRSRTTFVACDDDGAEFERIALDGDGRELGEPRRGRATWAELQGHASFPADAASRSRATIDTPLGPLDCLRYDVTREEATMTFWFSTGHPGQPVRFVLPSPDGERTTTVTALGPSAV